MLQTQSWGSIYISATFGDFEISGDLGPISLVGLSALRVQGKPSKQRVTSSFRKRSKQWPVPGRETEKLAYVRAGNFGRFWRLWALIDVSESGVVRLNGPKTSPERTHPQPLSHSNGRSLFFSQSSNQNAPISGEIWSKSGQIARNAQRSAGLSHLWVQTLGGSLLDPPPISGAAGNFTK